MLHMPRACRPCAPLSLRMQHILRCSDNGPVNDSIDKTRRDGHGNWGAGGLPVAGASEVCIVQWQRVIAGMA